MVEDYDKAYSAIDLLAKINKSEQIMQIEQEKEYIEELKRREMMDELKMHNDLLLRQIQDANERAIKAEKSAKKSNIVAIISATIAGCSFIVAIASLIAMFVK